MNSEPSLQTAPCCSGIAQAPTPELPLDALTRILAFCSWYAAHQALSMTALMVQTRQRLLEGEPTGPNGLRALWIVFARCPCSLDSARAACVCTAWRAAVSTCQHLWRGHLQQEFGLTLVPDGTTAHHFFQLCVVRWLCTPYHSAYTRASSTPVHDLQAA